MRDELIFREVVVGVYNMKKESRDTFLVLDKLILNINKVFQLTQRRVGTIF